jgi:Uma2 family endonuclease
MTNPMTTITTRSLTWQDLLDDPKLHDLPYKIELNERGQIIMSPTTNFHSDFQSEIERLLWQLLPKGRPSPECTIKTRLGERVADVVWASFAFRRLHRHEAVYSQAPEICIEVMSNGNTWAEMEEKVLLYLAAGAQEVWICRFGPMIFFTADGEQSQSSLAPNFPAVIAIEDELEDSEKTEDTAT